MRSGCSSLPGGYEVFRRGKQFVFRKTDSLCSTQRSAWSPLRPRSSLSRTRSRRVPVIIVLVQLSTFASRSPLSPLTENGIRSNRPKRKAATSTRTSSHLQCLLFNVPPLPNWAFSAAGPRGGTRSAVSTATTLPPDSSQTSLMPLSILARGVHCVHATPHLA